MTERVFRRRGDGGLEPMQGRAFTHESELDDLLASDPRLLEEALTTEQRSLRLLLVGRQVGIDDEGG